MTSTVFAGVDGGGTKTTIVLVDEAGHEVARHATSTSNAAVIGHDAAGQVLSAGLKHVLSVADANLGGAWLGLSGGDRPEDHRQLRPHLEALTPQMHFTNDAELIIAALPDGIGLVVVAGTGSIAFGYDATGQRVRSGGWGQLLGDEGSGYDLARGMLMAFTAQVDGRGPDTSCRDLVMSHLGLAEPFQLIQWVYARERTKGEIASLSSIVLAAAEHGDSVAADIVTGSANALAHTALAAARRLDLPSPLPLALTGGLLSGSEPFRTGFLSAFCQECPSVDVTVVTDPALVAARAVAFGSIPKRKG